MKSFFYRVLFVIGALITILFIILMDSKAQETTIEEGDVCVAYIADWGRLTGVNLSKPTEGVLIAEDIFNFTVDSVYGDVYIARYASAEGFYEILNFSTSDTVYLSRNQFFGFYAYNRQLMYADVRITGVDDFVINTYLYNNGISTQMLIGGRPAFHTYSTLFMSGDGTIYLGGQSNPNLHGQQFAYSPDGSHILSTGRMGDFYLYSLERNLSEEISFEQLDEQGTYGDSAGWLPDGSIMLSTLNVLGEVNQSTLWRYDLETGSAATLFSRSDTLIRNPQVIPCDYLLN